MKDFKKMYLLIYCSSYIGIYMNRIMWISISSIQTRYFKLLIYFVRIFNRAQNLEFFDISIFFSVLLLTQQEFTVRHCCAQGVPRASAASQTAKTSAYRYTLNC